MPLLIQLPNASPPKWFVAPKQYTRFEKNAVERAHVTSDTVPDFSLLSLSAR